MEKLTANRNFINKLWNGGKFILFNLAQVEQAELDALATSSFTQAEVSPIICREGDPGSVGQQGTRP
eukprot:7040984-Pyramimonas_sp.AAC.1